MTTKISNPLTVVAIFSGLAEAFATIALINVPSEIQQVFVYFVMFFPTLIVVLFFAVLNWNHTVLYAPSDFEDEGAFLETIKIKDSLKSELTESLATLSFESAGLTPQQIQARVSEKVDKVIENASLSSRKEQILALLSEGPSSPGAISQQLGLNRSYAYRLLGSLAEEGRITQLGTGKSVVWALSNQARNA